MSGERVDRLRGRVHLINLSSSYMPCDTKLKSDSNFGLSALLQGVANMRYISALSAFVATAAAALAFDPTAYENTQIQRTYELGGAVTNVQTVYTVRALKENSGGYELVLKGPEEENDPEGTDYWEIVQGTKVWDSLVVSSGSDG